MHPNYKIAFLTEMNFSGKVQADHPNMRTEFAWMHALNADHYNIREYNRIAGYDHVFIIFPKGRFNLNAVGDKISNVPNPNSDLLASNIVESLHKKNKKVYLIQEGPHWMFNDLEIADQINFYNMLNSVDAIFAHNESDVQYYSGLAPQTPAHVIRSLMIEDSIKNIGHKPEDKVIIGGNFSRWYGGFESFIVAQEFEMPVWCHTSHAKRDNEDQIVNHLPRLVWVDWIKALSTFKYAVHLMPTVGAGTFYLNCAYLGIPCIGNKDLDTQAICYPALSIDVNDVKKARTLAKRLLDDKSFYEECSSFAKNSYNTHYEKDIWLERILKVL